MLSVDGCQVRHVFVGGAMSRPIARRTTTFIVRVWAEYLEQNPPTWRGEVQVAATRELLHFQSLGELVNCLERRVSEKDSESGGH